MSVYQVVPRRLALLILAGVMMTATGGAIDRVNAANPRDDKPTNACVVLLHGLGRTHRSMAPLASFLETAGFRTANIDYPSTERTIEQLADSVVTEGINACRDTVPGAPIHFVTHSMGGILVRYYLSRRSIPELGRVVMISPPNQGSEAAEALRQFPPYQWLNGPAGQQLGTGSGSLPASLGPVEFPLGIITGSQNSILDFWLGGVFTGTNDGKVSAARAKVAGMSDFIVLPHNHTFIMQQSDVMAQVLFFLRNGRFRYPPVN